LKVRSKRIELVDDSADGKEKDKEREKTRE